MYKETIAKDRIQAIKNKDSKMKEFLDVVQGEIQLANAKGDVSNDQVEIILQKMKQNSIDLKEKYGKDTQYEIDYLSKLLPSLISPAELTKIIELYFTNTPEFKNMNSGKATGNIIKLLKENDIKFDSKLVKPIIENILK